MLLARQVTKHDSNKRRVTMTTPDELNALSMETAAAIIAGNRLIARLNVEGLIEQSRENVDSWLLYAWTSDSPVAATLAIDRSLQIDPDNELALAGKRWLQGIQELVDGMVEANDVHQAAAKLHAVSNTNVSAPEIETKATETDGCGNPEEVQIDSSTPEATNGAAHDSCGEGVAPAETEAQGQSAESPQETTEDSESVLAVSDQQLSPSEILADVVEKTHDSSTPAIVTSENEKDEPQEETTEQAKPDDLTPPRSELDSLNQIDSEISLADEIRLSLKKTIETFSATERPVETASKLSAEEHSETTPGSDVVDSTEKALAEVLALDAADVETASDSDDSAESQIAKEIESISEEVGSVVAPSTKTRDASEGVAVEPGQSEPSVRPVVLIIDDSATIRKLVTMVLADGGFDIVTAAAGDEGLTLVSQQKPDLVLVDVSMPDMDGYQVCKAIRADEETSEIPVLLLGSKDNVIEKMRSKLSGASGTIAKPFEARELLSEVQQHLQSVIA